MAHKSTSADSRNQILKSFQQLLDARKASGFAVATKEELAERQVDRDTVARASGYTVESIVKGLADLQLDFGSVVDGLSSKLTAESSKLGELRRAIEVETRSSAELQNIRVAADALDILNQEHVERMRAFEADAQARRDALEAEMAERRAAWSKQLAEFEAGEAAHFEQLRKERKLAEDDFAYELERQRTVETDEYAERKRRLERELEETTRDRERVWTEREAVLAERAAQIVEYKAKVDGMPAELEAAVKKAREEAIRETFEAEQFKANLLEKEVSANERVYEAKVASLESTIEQQTAQIASLTAQLQAALKQAQDLAMKAVEGTSKAPAVAAAAGGSAN